MTPAARVAAAIEILDASLDGTPTERALTHWGRTHRFAGSKDRAAIRDHVFDALRSLRTYAWAGGKSWPDTDGRAVMIGALRCARRALSEIFSGQGHAPGPLSDVEHARLPEIGSADGAHSRVPQAETWNMPDDAAELLVQSLGHAAGADTARVLTTRAPITLRVNLRRISRDRALDRLQADGIRACVNPLSPSALRVIEGARRIAQSTAFQEGLVELQDASSQAVVDGLPLKAGEAVLDFCAGGGGKSLALAMHTGAPVFAFDARPRRMSDIPERAKRAGADIRICRSSKDVPATFPLVLADAPCSGSGAWRRAPDGKWAFSQNRLASLTAQQDAILEAAAHHVAPKGVLAYATCSVFAAENTARVSAFLARSPGWSLLAERSWLIGPEGDGFFCAQLQRE